MAQFRVEIILDGETGRYFVEVYQRGESTPLFVGLPIYLSHEHAVAYAVEIFKAALPEKPITAWVK